MAGTICMGFRPMITGAVQDIPVLSGQRCFSGEGGRWVVVATISSAHRGSICLTWSPISGPRPEREGTIWYPFHGWEKHSVRGDHARLAAEIKDVESGRVTICLYWLEFANPDIRQAYESQGFRVICHGERGSRWDGAGRDFLRKQLAELRRHRRVASNRLGSAAVLRRLGGLRGGRLRRPDAAGGRTARIRRYGAPHAPVARAARRPRRPRAGRSRPRGGSWDSTIRRHLRSYGECSAGSGCDAHDRGIRERPLDRRRDAAVVRPVRRVGLHRLARRGPGTDHQTPPHPQGHHPDRGPCTWTQTRTQARGQGQAQTQARNQA